MHFLNFRNIFFVVVVIFNGCVSNNFGMPTVKQDKIPKWYMNAPQNNDIYIYGTSSASTLKEAKINALDDMSSRLIVNVSSSLRKQIKTSQIDAKQTAYTKDITQDINVEVEKIRFTNAKVEKKKLVNNQIYLIMKVDRKNLFKQNLKAFKILDNTIDEKISNLSSLPILQQIYKLQNLYPKLIEAKKKAYVLYAINNDFDYNSYSIKYDKLIDKIDKLKSKIIVKVTSDMFKDEIIDSLNKNNYKVSSQNHNVIIQPKSDIRHSNYKGWFIVKATITISIKVDGKIIQNKIINTVGRSSSNKQNALASAKHNFKIKLDKMGVDSILFNM